MAYGQINYTQPLGTGPSVAAIADVGCFLVAFCNLLERFGETVDPPSLNNYFVAHGSYLADGDDRDALGWGSISSYDGSIVATHVGGAGWPADNNAIVKFIYRSQRTGKPITHFCLVADHSQAMIVDSYDGRVKISPYGAPVSWATYEKHGAQIVTPPPPPEEPAFSVEGVPEQTFELKLNTHLWDLNQRSWPGMVNNPVRPANAGDKFSSSRIAHHVLGGSYYLPDGDDAHGFNEVDCKAYTAPAPTPPPTGGLPMGNPDDKYELIKLLPGFRTATDAGNHTNQANEVEPGIYFVYNTHPKNSNLVNVTSVLGKPGSWVNKADNVPDAPPEPPAPPAPEPEPAAPEAHIETAAVDSTTPIGWRDTFAPFPKPVHYIATRDITVEDKSGQQSDMPLRRYDPGISDTQGVVSAFGTFTWTDGVEYYRLKTNNDPDFNYWYAVAKMDQNTHTPNLLVMPAKGGPLGKLTVAHDTLQLAKSRLETDLPKFLELTPKFLRKKNKK